MKHFRAAAGFFAAGFLILGGGASGQEGAEGVDFGVIGVSRLRCTIGNNKAKGEHQAGYNGVFSMISPDCADSPFVPSWAGLNLEFFFDARPPSSDRIIRFEPRNSHMEFKRLGPTSAELHQPDTPFYGLESRTIFELKEPYYLDMIFRCIPRKSELTGGFFGVFWASYIDDPDNKSIYFLGDHSTLDKPFWVQFMAQQHNRDSTVLSEKAAIEVMQGLYRHRLSCAISQDGGETWRNFKNFESLDDIARVEDEAPGAVLYGPARQPLDRKRYHRAPGPLRVSYPSCTFADGNAIITYGVSTLGDKETITRTYGMNYDEVVRKLGMGPEARANKVRVVPIPWFYEK